MKRQFIILGLFLVGMAICAIEFHKIHSENDQLKIFLFGNSKSIPSINLGTGPNTGTGMSLRAFAVIMKQLVDEWNVIGLSDVVATGNEINLLAGMANLVYIGDIAIMTAQVDASLTDNTPTDAEITAALGKTATVAGKNYTRIIKDTDGSGLVYLVVSDGTSWQYIKLIIAV